MKNREIEMKNLILKITEINEKYEDIYCLTLQKKEEQFHIVDENEELYYGGCNFDKVLDELTQAAVKDTKDKTTYLDCICPGRWVVA